MSLDTFKKDSAYGNIYSLPQGIEVVCATKKDHGILEVRSMATAHYRVSRGSHTIVLWNNPAMINPLDSDKKFRKEKRRLEKHIASVFETTGNGLFSIAFNQFEVKTNTINQCQISNYIPNCFQPIVFQPFAFFKDGARCGGAYFTLSSTLSQECEKSIYLKCNAIQKIITGLCLRPNFLMITEKGEYADLVDMVYLNVPKFQEKKIVDFKIIDGIHPYETANIEMLRMLLPFFTAITRTRSPSLFFHLPLAEYLIYGVSIFLAGNMTLEALDVYANLLVDYGSALQRKLLACLENVLIHFSSPLDVLIQNIVFLNGSFTRQFFRNIGIPLEQDKPDRNMAREVAYVVLKYLKAQPGICGVAWTRMTEQVLQDGGDLSLKRLTECSNSVHVAIQSFGSSVGEVAVVEDCGERPVTIAFKKYFQGESWPSILCFHWLVPLGMPSVSTLFDLRVNPDGEHCSITEIQKMIRESSNRISKHGI